MDALINIYFMVIEFVMAAVVCCVWQSMKNPFNAMAAYQVNMRRH